MLGWTPLVSGALFLPVIMFTSIVSVCCGQYMARYFRYMPCVAVGFGLWTLANGLTCMFDQNTGLGALIPILALEGCGVGFTLQPSMSPLFCTSVMIGVPSCSMANVVAALIGLLANTNSDDRAVCTGLRNFLRTSGGSFGLVGEYRMFV